MALNKSTGYEDLRALVVDDSNVLRRIMTASLSRLKITKVDQAKGGNEALKFLETEQYDLLLLDWKMPDLPGIDVLKSLRESGNDVPVIMVTSEIEKEKIMEALRAGASSYVVKPFEPEILVQKITDVLSKVES